MEVAKRCRGRNSAAASTTMGAQDSTAVGARDSAIVGARYGVAVGERDGEPELGSNRPSARGGSGPYLLLRAAFGPAPFFFFRNIIFLKVGIFLKRF